MITDSRPECYLSSAPRSIFYCTSRGVFTVAKCPQGAYEGTERFSGSPSSCHRPVRAGE